MKKNTSSFKNQGFSLISAIVACAILGIATLVLMRIIDGMQKSHKFVSLTSSENDIKLDIMSLLSNEKNCRVGLAGEGPYGTPSNPIQFNKNQIDFDNKEITEDTEYTPSDEGLEVELWQSDLGGEVRTFKRFNGKENPPKNEEPDKSEHDGIVISSIKLVMNNGAGACGGNYCEGRRSDLGQIVVMYTKNIEKSVTRSKRITFDVNVQFITDSSGNSTILSCSKGPKAGSNPTTPKGFCSGPYIQESPSFQDSFCHEYSGYSKKVFKHSEIIYGVSYNTILCCYLPTPEVGQGFCSPNLTGGVLDIPDTGCSFLNDSRYEVAKVSSSKKDYFTCCALPKDSSVANVICTNLLSTKANSDSIFDGCPPIPGYRAKTNDSYMSRTQSRTSSCCWEPEN